MGDVLLHHLVVHQVRLGVPVLVRQEPEVHLLQLELPLKHLLELLGYHLAFVRLVELTEQGGKLLPLGAQVEVYLLQDISA